MSRQTISIKTRYGSHICLFEPDREKGGYVVTAKDVKGVVTWGKNLVHAKAMAKEALELSIESLALEHPVSVAARSQKITVA